MSYVQIALNAYNILAYITHADSMYSEWAKNVIHTTYAHIIHTDSTHAQHVACNTYTSIHAHTYRYTNA